MKPLSIQLYTVRELAKDGKQLDVLKKIAEIGYAGVEGYYSQWSPAEFRKIVEDLGMKVSSYFGGVPTPENVGEFIDTAKTLGTSLTVAGFWIPDLESVEAIEKSAAKLNAVVPTILDAGLSFSLHNHWMEFEDRDGKLVVDRLLELVPGLTLELDIYWCSNFGAHKPEAMAAKYADKVKLMHVKDGPLVKGEPHVAVGQGKVNVPATIHAADESVVEWMIVELDECGTDMMKAVEESYEYLVGNGLAAGNRPV